ncbi:MAG: hypothetical protein HY996_07730 [Micrococcales bacterium]|nr:hypothetical protein [Micrococcales bacterium]
MIDPDGDRDRRATTRIDTMPYRSRSTLESWIAEFRSLGFSLHALRVLDQDVDGNEDTGLIALSLDDATTSVYVQPATTGTNRWAVTFEARDEAIELSVADVAKLSDELNILACLCTFLEAKSLSTPLEG